jgi:ABC-2 type transport system ATP-binding protein
MNHRAVTASDEVAISVRDLDVHRGGKRVLPGISLEIRRGVVTGLLGPSGSGKTTLIRSIVGVQIVKSGQVTVLGRPAGTPELRRRVAYVTQAPSVYGDLTVRENLRYFAGVLDAPRERIDETIAEVGLEQEAEQVVRTLSGGEQSRSSLAAALLGEPEVLLLDEPTVGLDPVLRGELWRKFHALAEEGRAVLVSTHVMDEAERCDELILMREGRIVAAAAPRTLLEQTKTDSIENAFLALVSAS